MALAVVSVTDTLLQAFNAKLSDFGYAKIIPGVDPSLTDPIFRTRASGIEGYLAPEYLATG